MRIDGYRPHGERHETDAFYMLLSDEVIRFLAREVRGANARHVRKVGHTLEAVRRNGLAGVSNSTLFVREEKFPSGQPGMSDIAVYAAKSWQLRVYGKLIRINGDSVFMCPEGTIKRTNRADQDQLARVAKVLGKYNDR